MAASVLHLLEVLETNLERTKAELIELREENDRLKQQLAVQPAMPAVESNQIVEDAARPAPAEPATHEAVQEIEEIQALEAVQEIAAEQESQQTEPPSPHALLKQWYQRYPQAFFKGHTKPLKVGIHQDLAEHEPWSGKLIRRALANYVNLPRYVKSMREGAERVDLHGNPAGKVDKDAAQHASERRKSSQPKETSTQNGKAGTQVPRSDQSSQLEPRFERRQQANKPQVAKTNQAEEPLSLEAKLKGLQQKFEGR